MIVIAHLGYRARSQRGRAGRSASACRARPTPTGWCWSFLGLVAIFLGIDEGTRVAIYVAPIWFAVLGLGYYFSRGSHLQPAQ